MTEPVDDANNTKLIALKKFFIFNSKYGSTEGEEKNKIMFYHPSENELDTKIKDIGLCEAIVKFTNTFTADESVYCMRTQKTLQLFYKPEHDFWMMMILNAPSERKTRDDSEYTEYRCEDAHEIVYREVLKQSYYMFRLFSGTFMDNLVGDNETQQVEHLINKLSKFYSKYVATLKTRNCDILDICRSIQYLPLNKFQFLRVHNFIQMIESTFVAIKHCIFLFNEQLVWSGINPSDLYSIYEYLTGLLFPKCSADDVRGGSLTRNYSNGLDAQYGAYLAGPTHQGDNCKKPPTVYICNNGECQVYKMIVYNALSGTLCLFVKDKSALTNDFYEELHAFIGPQLTNIASDIAENLTKDNGKTSSLICTSTSSSIGNANADESTTQTTKYLFFNELNFQHNGSVHLNQKLYKKKRSIPREIMNLLNDLYIQDANTSNSSEIIVKTLSDYWIVKRSTNWRHSFVIFNKNATLLDIAEEANKIFDTHLNDVFSHI
ncbi:vacuolar fusion protein CCZ1 homolog [Sitodiplosis mosellana]|uniref:vacuolar fusion protein CCZ1 homolog n=1 Tax=Sitodiplosis mosellana TaxID=263140 RepID=UPI002444C344|nr:vacuolar fusion protein CCZ1 homolog [Sitodiplosis mosellana]